MSKFVISIHAPLRGRPSMDTVPNERALFQSTPPCGGDRPGSRCHGWSGYFNPRPLAGATNQVGGDAGALGISIHAPLRGRRFQEPLFVDGLTISIHAPLRGRRAPDLWRN